MTTTTYRQRFTEIGWIGVAAILGSYMLSVWAWVSFTYTPSYRAEFPAFAVFASSFLFITGALMVIVGREFHALQLNKILIEEDSIEAEIPPERTEEERANLRKLLAERRRLE